MKKFEDLDIYKKSRLLCNVIYNLDNPEYKRDFGFKDQIRRASVSVLNNIAEGFERGSNRDFIRFLYYSKGSVGELRNLLNLAADFNYIENEKYNSTRRLCIEISQQLANFIKYLAKKC